MEVDFLALSDRIVVDSKILTGKPVVRGTRVAVELVVGLLAAGWSHAQILSSYPHLTEDDIRAYLSYASELLREEKWIHDGLATNPFEPSALEQGRSEREIMRTLDDEIPAMQGQTLTSRPRS